MKILFVLHHAGVGPFARTLRLLAERGHRIEVVFQRVKTAESQHDLERLTAEFQAITVGRAPGRGNSDWSPLARKLRNTIDYLRYLQPRYRAAGKLRARAERNAPVAGRRLAGWARVFGPPGVAAMLGTLRRVERCLPPPPSFEQYLRGGGFDLLLVTPLIELGSSQADWLRAGKRAGIRTGYPVLSWDNLTNKGLLRDVPDRVFVWNEVQAGEAEKLHGVPRGRVRVTGAQPFDHWFEWGPSRSREDFCDEVGLRADRPILLYVCSSGFIAPDEPAFVRRWIADLRARDGVLAEAGLLIRPHPLFATQWEGVDLGDAQASIWPAHGEDPSSEQSRRNYFDSIHHSAAMVGINTTAQIEGAIVGRPVHTVLADEFRLTQEGTLHFHYLEDGESGELIVGRTFDEHAAQLEESLRGRDDEGRNERFLRWFVRPLGLDVPASEQLASAVDELGRDHAPAPDPGPALQRPVRFVLRPFARTAADRATERRRATDKRRHPEHHLRKRALNMSRHSTRAPAVFGPWLGDEIGELLYWIPYLRWVQTATVGLGDRFYILRRPSTASWYDGLGYRQIDAEAQVEKARLPEVLGVQSNRYLTLGWDEVERVRGELASHTPHRRIQRRLLEFAPLKPPAGAADLDLPASFVAVRGASAELGVPTVSLDGLDRARATAVISRSDGFVGAYGIDAFLAPLLGVPAVALREAEDPGADRDLRLASYFLGRAPFGALETVAPADASGAIVRMLQGRHEPAPAPA